ncbi:MAG: hypothetical protein KA004_01910 [Verrucomicrobiales bacterium]|nr:hypothetical protein [Verrucomicrobiales bacterium]
MKTTHRRALAFVGLLGSTAALSAPADTPEFLTNAAAWKHPDFTAALTAPEAAADGPVLRHFWKSPPAIFGVQPHSASARIAHGAIDSLSFAIFDAGTYFGFQNQNITGPVETAHRKFDAEFHRRLESVRSGLLTASGGREKKFTLGEKNGLTWPARLYACEGTALRLIAVEQQLILLDVFPTVPEALSVRCAPWLEMRRRRGEEFRAWLKTDGLPCAGDREIRGIPMLPQGNRGYCGAAILAMTAHYLGLQTGTEELAVLADFRYGATTSPDIRNLSSQIARAAGVTARRSGKFDYALAKTSIDAGMPVVVFRRWAAERDYLHTLHSNRLKEGGAPARLPEPGMEDRKTWPGKNAPAHASIVHGYNDQRREVIFTESWAVAARSRRMRVEELEATSYYAVYFLP